MKRSAMLFAGLVLSASLMGCSNSQEAEQLSQLTNKVDALTDQVAAMQVQQDNIAGAVNETSAAADAAYQEAMRANQRIDNVATSYRK
ncbi:membrane protein [Photobacterium aquae]|uniref:Major outer membrane lipoprotein Lpp n=1 Tax=Photobacterium aquae TaxID=1195763 RepID=A0A0J1H0Y9_9GAMM|nr:Lpp/OprI family alanine-zipper lipoprotein [Photobacterium aquae]KLV05464.1 membrane protein [Photobacterium aquae]